MPKWGISRGEYFFDTEKRIIAKGLSSIKFMGEKVASELYQLSRAATYTHFTDLLLDLNTKTTLDSRQLDTLIKLDFFSDFGNQRELLRINDLFAAVFKKGDVKKIRKDQVDGTPIGPIVEKYAVGVTKNGASAKSYTVLDVVSMLHETEQAVKAIHMPDLSDVMKVKNFNDIMGYAGYVSGKEEDRRKLYVSDVFPVVRKKDNKQFGYSVLTKSIGSGKESRFTVFNPVYNKLPIQKGDIILCKGFLRDGPYFRLTAYDKLQA